MGFNFTTSLSFVAFSSIGLFCDARSVFTIIGNDMYKPVVFSSFYISGFVLFDQNNIQNLRRFGIQLFVICILFAVALVYGLQLNFDFGFHNLPPDLYFVSGSFSMIGLLLIFKNEIVRLIQKNIYVQKGFNFFHKHVFSIFLLHTFGIYLSEVVFGLVEPDKKTILYGVIKLCVVLIITCALSPFFTMLSALIVKLCHKVAGLQSGLYSKK